MKRITAILVLLLCACGADYQFPAFTDHPILEGEQIFYSPSEKQWKISGQADENLIFTKHISVGSGSYSEYVSDSGTLPLSSTQEYLVNGRLIGYSEHNLKFYETKATPDGFVTDVLSTQEVENLFPGLDLVLTSQVVDGELLVGKLPWESKIFLLLNDTPDSYYHYSFENEGMRKMPFKSAVYADKAEVLIYSHFGNNDAMNPALVIHIKNRL